MFTLMAGHETVTSLIGSGLWLLASHPDQLDLLRRDPMLCESAIEEMLRYEPPAQLTTKTAVSDLEIGGRDIRAGELVVASFAAANRDPAIFATPSASTSHVATPGTATSRSATAPTTASARPGAHAGPDRVFDAAGPLPAPRSRSCQCHSPTGHRPARLVAAAHKGVCDDVAAGRAEATQTATASCAGPRG